MRESCQKVVVQISFLLSLCHVICTCSVYLCTDVALRLWPFTIIVDYN